MKLVGTDVLYATVTFVWFRLWVRFSVLKIRVAIRHLLIDMNSDFMRVARDYSNGVSVFHIAHAMEHLHVSRPTVPSRTSMTRLRVDNLDRQESSLGTLIHV